MLRRTRFVIRAQNVQCIKIFMHFGHHAIHQRHKIFAVFIRTFDDFVINVGDVAHVLELVAQEAQVTRHYVKCHKRSPVTDMTEVVNRDTTHVHPDFPGMYWFEFLFLAAKGIKDF
ncbi:Uncharacterised protein [Atlantibacter hermannii]|nr:Uncharacterised protein [Atlantibacter hermannii]